MPRYVSPFLEAQLRMKARANPYDQRCWVISCEGRYQKTADEAWEILIQENAHPEALLCAPVGRLSNRSVELMEVAPETVVRARALGWGLCEGGVRTGGCLEIDVEGVVHRLGDTACIGRNPGASGIAVSSSAVSEVHATFAYREDRRSWCVLSQGRNMSSVNGRELANGAWTELSAGDSIVLAVRAPISDQVCIRVVLSE